MTTSSNKTLGITTAATILTFFITIIIIVGAIIITAFIISTRNIITGTDICYCCFRLDRNYQCDHCHGCTCAAVNTTNHVTDISTDVANKSVNAVSRLLIEPLTGTDTTSGHIVIIINTNIQAAIYPMTGIKKTTGRATATSFVTAVTNVIPILAPE